MRAAVVIGLAVALSSASASALADTDVTERAQQIVEAQIASLGDLDALQAMFSSAAVIQGNGSVSLASDPAAPAIIATLSSSARSSAPLHQTQVVGVAAGHASGMLWLHAQVIFIRADATPLLAGRYRGLAPVVRTTAWLTELVLDDGKAWKVQALSFFSTSGITAPGTTYAPGTGPLATLLGSPDRLDAELRDDATTLVSLGEASAIGYRDARAALAPWRGRPAKLTGVLEARASTGAWGIAAGTVEIDKHPTHVTVIALGDGGRWKVVAVQAVGADLLRKIVTGPDIEITP